MCGCAGPLTLSALNFNYICEHFCKNTPSFISEFKNILIETNKNQEKLTALELHGQVTNIFHIKKFLNNEGSSYRYAVYAYYIKVNKYDICRRVNRK